MELTLVHPDDPESKVTLTNPIQVAAFKGQGFVEESQLHEVKKEDSSVDQASDLQSKLAEVEKELAETKKELKEARSAKTRLENKLKDKEGDSVNDPSQEITDPSEPEDPSKKETEEIK